MSVRTAPASGVSFLVVAGVLWGTGGLLGSMFGAAAGLAPLAVAAYRLLGGGLLLAALVIARGWRSLSGSAWRRIAVLGVLAAWFQGCYFTAVALSSVSLATLVTIGSAPVLVLLVARRHRTRAQLGGVALAVLGLALLVGFPGGSGSVLAGSAFGVLSGAGFVTMTLLSARPVAGLDDATATGMAFTTGGLLLAPVAALTSGLTFTPSPTGVGLLLVLAAVPTAVAYTAYFRGMRSAPAGVGVVMALLEPLTATALAAVFLGERLGPVGIVGAVLLCCALVLVGRRRA